ncbi:GntR family transcriptional regulator [Kribbella sp. NBC_00709]|uniref:GntR family transcriptional regulator n=1 Tax=Kribbella sp. NBC_00709 TaxID=2975972 RepID=UPI002E2923EC|nr:GntR family transcriptional regulator [Kribbella sp. NBC_00709]
MTTISAGPGAGAEPTGVRHVKRPTPLRESVYEALTEMIIDGTLERGRHLVEVELAGLLGVSRQPVREALQRLNNEGWVDLRPGFGAMVHVPAEDEVDQLLAARAALESESARLAARHATKDDVAKLRELCKVGTAYQESGDIDGTVRTNGELHSQITEMSGNRFLVDFAAQVDRRVRWYYTPVAPVRGAASWREHNRLVKAISEGDEDKAAQIMREHTEHTRKAYHDLQAATAPESAPEPEAAPRRRRRTT